MAEPLRRQVIVITGASSGIGLATAREAARRGACVVMAARNAADLAREAEELVLAGGEALAVPVDVADYAGVERLAERAVEAYGRIDAWVNGAAVVNVAEFRDQSVRDFEQVMRVDFMGQVHGAKAALPHLERTGGALVCIGSAYSDHGSPLWSSYSAAKHALKGWLDALRVELAHAGSDVRVTLVKPSTINTPLFSKAKTEIGVAPRGIPPIYQPEVVARAILRAATRDGRDVHVGAPAVLMALGERLSPGLLDAFMRVAGYRLQRTDEPKSADSPHNLYGPTEHDGGVHGGFRALPFTLSEPVAAHPAVASLTAAAALGIGAIMLRRAGREVGPALLGAAGAAMALRGLLSAAPSTRRAGGAAVTGRGATPAGRRRARRPAHPR